MRTGCRDSQKLTEIDSIYLEGVDKPGFYAKESIHDYLKTYPGIIKVNLRPYPDVIPAVSIYREKYVKSEPNQYGDDNLLCLPRV
jgi:hypothetical protein